MGEEVWEEELLIQMVVRGLGITFFCQYQLYAGLQSNIVLLKASSNSSGQSMLILRNMDMSKMRAHQEEDEK